MHKQPTLMRCGMAVSRVRATAIRGGSVAGWLASYTWLSRAPALTTYWFCRPLLWEK